MTKNPEAMTAEAVVEFVKELTAHKTLARTPDPTKQHLTTASANNALATASFYERTRYMWVSMQHAQQQLVPPEHHSRAPESFSARAVPR